MPRCACGVRFLTRNSDKCAVHRREAARARQRAYAQRPDVKARKNAERQAKRAKGKARRDLWAGILADVAKRRAA